MKLLKLTDRDGNAVLVDVGEAVTIQRRYDDPTRTEIVWKERHLFVAVRETPDEIAAMLAGIAPATPPPKSALEAAAPDLLAALKAAHEQIQDYYAGDLPPSAATITRMEAAIAKAEGRA